MVPLPEHDKQVDMIVDIVKVLLRHRGLRFDSYYKTSMDLPVLKNLEEIENEEGAE